MVGKRTLPLSFGNRCGSTLLFLIMYLLLQLVLGIAGVGEIVFVDFSRKIDLMRCGAV